MTRHTLGLLLTGLTINTLTALGMASSWLAYSSGDGSGLQYMFLYLGVMIAGVAGAATILLWITRILPALNLLTPALAIGLGLVPQIFGTGYNGSVIDRPGQIAGTGLLVLQAAMTAYSAWWLWRRENVAAVEGGPSAQPR